MAQTPAIGRRDVPVRPAPERGSIEDHRRVIERLSQRVDATVKRLNVPNFKVTTQTSSSVTLTTADEFVVVDASSNDVTVNLPASHSIGETFTVKRTDATGSTVTIDGNGNTIDGNTSIALSQYDAIRVFSDGTNWFIF